MPIWGIGPPAGTGVYGMGCYVIGMGIDEIRSALSSRLFTEYAASVGTPKRGGYLAVSGGRHGEIPALVHGEESVER